MYSLIEWISSWAQQVIVAVVIATLLEMILPNGSSRKYIKTVIGVYIVFVILSPIVTKVVQGESSFSKFDYENYFKNDTIYNTMSNTLSNEIDTDIEQTYIVSLKQDMKMKLEEKGFSVNDIKLEVNLEEGKEYGMITYLEISVIKETETEKEENKEQSMNIQVNQVEVVNTQKNIQKANNITSSEERQIKEYLQEEYGVKKDYITVNGKEED